MKSYRIVWTREDIVSDVDYIKFPSEPVAKAYVQGCLDGLHRGFQEYRDVILAIDTRPLTEQDKYYKDPIAYKYGHQTPIKEEKSDEDSDSQDK